MRNSERTIRLNEAEIGLDDLSGFLLDPTLPVSSQNERYRDSITILRDFLDVFRKPNDPRLALFQAPYPSRIPIEEFIKRGLVSESGRQRIQNPRDEMWTTFDTITYPEGSFVDQINMSYIARYSSYDEMRTDIVASALPDQESRIEKFLPAVSFDQKDAHITLEETYELNDLGLSETRKRMTGFHFHIENNGRRVGFIPDDTGKGCDSIELTTPEEISSRAYNRVFCAVFLPFLLNAKLGE